MHVHPEVTTRSASHPGHFQGGEMRLGWPQREVGREGGTEKNVCASVFPCLPYSTTHSTHLTHVHNTPSPVVGGRGAVVVSSIISATDGPRMQRGPEV